MKKYNCMITVTLIIGLITIKAADIQRIPYPKRATGKGATLTAQMVIVDNIVFPAAICGSSPNVLQQIDEVLETMHKVLSKQGLGIGNMIQHTIFLKNGAATPMDVLNRFHKTATRLAPGLKKMPSVGTIIRVPELPDKKAMIMLDMVAGLPLYKDKNKDGYTRIPFTFGPQEIVETIADNKILFTAGTEGMDFQHGTLAKDIDGQIVTIVNKLDTAIKKAGLTLSHMVHHNLYITQGTDPRQVIQKFHSEMCKHDAGAKIYLGTGSLMVVNGMAANGFLLEIDAIFTRNRPKSIKRVPFSELPMDVVKTAACGGLVFVTAMPGAVLEQKMSFSKNIDQQIEKAVMNIHQALKKSGLSLANMVKHRLILKKGGADPAHVRSKFHDLVTRLAPELKNKPSAEAFIIVEALETADSLFEVSVIAAQKSIL